MNVLEVINADLSIHLEVEMVVDIDHAKVEVVDSVTELDVRYFLKDCIFCINFDL